jgi:hypothetical protein
MTNNDVTTLSKQDILELGILKAMHNIIVEGYIEAIQSNRIMSDE